MRAIDLTWRTSGAAMLRGELDLSTASMAARLLGDVSADGGPLSIDVTDLAFIDLAGLRVLIDAAVAWDGLELRGCSGEVRRLIEIADRLCISGIDRVRWDDG
jgi:anti-anti-sigma factor